MAENARGGESAQIHVFSGSLLKRERKRENQMWESAKNLGILNRAKIQLKLVIQNVYPGNDAKFSFQKLSKQQQKHSSCSKTAIKQQEQVSNNSSIHANPVEFFFQDHGISLFFPVRFRCHSPRRDWTWKRVCLAVGDGKRRIRRKEKKTKTKSERENMWCVRSAGTKKKRRKLSVRKENSQMREN